MDAYASPEKMYVVLEAISPNGLTAGGPGEAITSAISLSDAEAILGQLWADDRFWWIVEAGTKKPPT